MLRIEKIEKYFGEKKALTDISFSVDEGEIFGLIGQENAGKTTLFRIIAGLLKPDRGSVWLGKERIQDNPWRAKMEVGYVPSACRLYDKLKVREYMEFYAGFYPLEGLKKERWIREILDQMDLLPMSETYVEKLSKGMGRRLCVAQALLSDPQLLILDETGNGLDGRARQEFKKILKRLSQSNRTILISSHNISELPDYCTSMGILEQGEMILQGSMAQMIGEIKMRQPILIQTLSGQDTALRILKDNDRVQKITLMEDGMLVGFDGSRQQEAQLLGTLIREGVDVCGFSRDNENFEHSVMNIISGRRAEDED